MSSKPSGSESWRRSRSAGFRVAGRLARESGWGPRKKGPASELRRRLRQGRAWRAQLQVVRRSRRSISSDHGSAERVYRSVLVALWKGCFALGARAGGSLAAFRRAGQVDAVRFIFPLEPLYFPILPHPACTMKHRVASMAHAGTVEDIAVKESQQDAKRCG